MLRNDQFREIRITYVHIITLIVAFVIMCIALFALGYKMGKSSIKDNIGELNNNKTDRKIINVSYKNKSVSSKTVKTKKNNKPSGKIPTEITKEVQMHQAIEMNETKKPLKKRKEEKPRLIKSKRIVKSTVFVIQIGAYRNYEGAKKEAQKFAGKYTEEIIKKGNLYKVIIGSYKTRKRALLEIKRNKKLKGCMVVSIKR